ncbi:PTS system, mannitol-specific IIBC component, putative [Spiroplasma clarkii]|uniref:PTS system mannitol-specific EIICB component n=1 Tax=Spiroplasma clarkii TaxID=2139 RepID=A0A1Y0KZ63_9MOLU|nr:PTS transporter subunit EIIC [Spiroplasma clarkii]ARU91017.1 PTS system, mannitol-specific IIBC component, putative [Spiroplasma clarkii]ATX70460.1 PTS system, mannitol-specific IIB component [Spiroplasma clarkii]
MEKQINQTGNLNVKHKSLKAKNFKLKIQKMGAFMAGMIMPSVGILLAWGLWTSMFLYDYDANKNLGWFNAPMLGKLIEPGIKWLLPILIAFNGGKLIYGIRGGMFATFVMLGTIVGTDWIYGEFITLADGTHPGSPNQFIGAMVMGPVSALFLKYVEKLYINKINKSFDMLVKNFGTAILGIVFCSIVFFGWGWVMWGITWVMMQIIQLFGDNKWAAPLMGIFTEPIKVSFLNNALNHGVLGPIGYNEIALQTQNGVANPRSIFFLFDPNPGPGMGMLIAYIVFTKGESRYNAAGSTLIHTIGGIHEVYFVFILSKPKMVLATMAGVVGAQFITSYFGGGTIATPSPGSIIALIALSPGVQALLINLLSFAVGAGIAFGVATPILLSDKNRNKADASTGFTISDEGITFSNNEEKPVLANNKDFSWANVKSIVVACEAGMGSSAMASGVIAKFVKQNNLEIKVSNIAVKDLDDSFDVIVTMQNFVDFAKQRSPHAFVYKIDKFMGKGVYDALFAYLLPEKVEKG